MNAPGPPSLETFADQAMLHRPAPMALDSSFKSIFDDLTDGVLVMDAGGHRIYSNPALNELVSGNACLPTGTPEPPAYVPADQRHRYMVAIQGTSSLLTLDGSGTASTWLDLVAPNKPRLRARITIGAFTGPRGRFAVWLFKPERPMAYTPSPSPDGWLDMGLPGGPRNLDELLGASPLSVVESLTRREKDVLELLLDGQRVSSIARRLYLSPQTVRNHLKSIFRKLGAHSQAELLDTLRPGGHDLNQQRGAMPYKLVPPALQP